MPKTIDEMIGDAQSIAAARQAVRALTAGSREDRVALAELLADELLTNAVAHGGGKFSLAARLDGTLLRVAVSDQSSSAPVKVYPPDNNLEHGRGLRIVDATASKWGIERRGSEKAVWFELDLT